MEQNTALLVMDMQMPIVGRLQDANGLIHNIRKAIEMAHEKKMQVIYVVLDFRMGTPEISGNNKSFAARIKDMWTPETAEQWKKIHPELVPQANDIVVTKRRVSAFTGSDLDVVLRAQNISHIVLTGIATSGVVLSTLREAADKDYRITVLEDGCADGDPEVHRVLTTKIFPRQADVLTVEEWSKS